ncbi:nuclear transport factor 2 family protein [Isoptericola sp. NPDC019482]|uniref:nuclear transport factor 2 family protein n=1 Tax=Isoptericola sp. NPDC019482 TaxID=3154688 RepID=UPI003479BDC0
MVDLTLDRLLGLERRGWDALCGSTGGAFYGDLMTPSALMVLVDGSVLDRDAVVASLDGAPPWDSYDLHDVRRVGLADGAAALVYRARAVRGDDPPFVALMASTYVVVDGEPRLALYQQTLL